ncbi:MAG: DUF433 domain-containing protein [Spirochaetales bacterium]|nr:DUF433 domain-containing protein [Spirochaetales bacterium]
MEYRNNVVVDHGIMLGEPAIIGTGITVEIILKILSEGMSIDELLLVYPDLTKNDVLAALSYSADVISREEMIGV